MTTALFSRVELFLKLASSDDAVISNPPREISRMLAEVSSDIRAGKIDGIIRDINGNFSGRWNIIIDQEEDA